MVDTQPIIIKSHSSQEQIDRAYQIMCDKSRELVSDYCTRNKIMLTELIAESGCPHPGLVREFVLQGDVAITGLDLENLLYQADLQQRFAEEVSVSIGSEVCYPEAVCGTTVDSDGKGSHRAGDEVQESFDRVAKLVLSRTIWFYVQATERFLNEQGRI